MAPLILLLDRDENTRGILRAYFEHHGHPVLDTGDCEEALSLARDHRPALLIGDFPREQGGHADFVDRLRREAGSSAPVLILTARATEDEVEAAKAIGQAVLTKPALPAAVLQAAKRLLSAGTRISGDGAAAGMQEAEGYEADSRGPG